MKLKKTRGLVATLLTAIALACAFCAFLFLPKSVVFAEEPETVVFSDAKGVAAKVDNTSGEAIDFTVTVTDTTNDSNVWTANNTGSVLLLGEDQTQPVRWSHQSVPAGFKGTVYVPLRHGYTNWKYDVMNKVFAGGTIWPAAATVEFSSDAFTDVTLLSESDATTCEGRTSVSAEMVSGEGVFADEVAALNAQTPAQMAYIEQTSTWGKTIVKGVSASTADSYGLAMRIINTGSKPYPLQLTVGSEKVGSSDTWLATKSATQYDVEKLYMTYVGKDGTTQKVGNYFGANIEAEGKRDGYFSVPAHADGVFIIPWTEMMFAGIDCGNFNGVAIFQVVQMNLIDSTTAYHDGVLALGKIGFLKADGFTEMADFREHDSFTFDKVKRVLMSESALTATAATDTQEDWYTLSSGGKTIEKTATVYTGQKIEIVPKANFVIKGATVNDGALEKTNGKYIYTVPEEAAAALALVVSAELLQPHGAKFTIDSSFVSEGVVPVSSMQAIAIDVNNTTGGELTFEITLTDAESYSYWIASEYGTVALMKSDGETIYSAPVIPAGFEGYVILAVSPVNAALTQHTHVNPTFISPSADTFAQKVLPDVYCRLLDGSNTEITDAAVLKDIQAVASWDDVRESALGTVKGMLKDNQTTRAALDAYNEQQKKDMGLITFTEVAPASALAYFKIDLKSYLNEDVYTAQKMPVALVMRAAVTGAKDWFYFQPRVMDKKGTMYEIQGNLAGWYMYGTDGEVKDINLTTNNQYITVKGDGVLVLPLATLANYQSGSNIRGRWEEVCAFESWLLNRDSFNKETILALGQWGILLEDGTVQNLFDFGDLESEIMRNAYLKNHVRISAVTSTTVTLTVNENAEDHTAIITPSDIVYLGDAIAITAAEGYKVTYVTVNGEYLESVEDKFIYTVKDTSAPIVIAAETEKIPEQGGQTPGGDPGTLPDKPSTDDNKDGGCGSAIGIPSVLGMSALLVAGLFLVLRKKSDKRK